MVTTTLGSLVGQVVRRMANRDQTVIGVVSGYRPETQKVRDKYGRETPYTYDTNTGIIIVEDIRHALTLIKRNPIGIPVR